MLAKWLFSSHLLNVVTEQLVLLCGERKGQWVSVETSAHRQVGSIPSGAREGDVYPSRLISTFIQIANGCLLLQEVTAELLVQAKGQHVVDEGAEKVQRCF